MRPAAKFAGPLTQLKEFTKMALWITSIALVGVGLRIYVQGPGVDSSAPASSTPSSDLN